MVRLCAAGLADAAGDGLGAAGLGDGLAAATPVATGEAAVGFADVSGVVPDPAVAVGWADDPVPCVQAEARNRSATRAETQVRRPLNGGHIAMRPPMAAEI